MDRKKFYATVRNRLGSLSQSQVDGIGVVLDATECMPLSWRAYILATAWHETGGLMQPVKEAHWLSENWRKANLRYYPYYGRGLPQITWKRNYEWLDEAAAEKGLIKKGELMRNLDLALRPDISALALVEGMVQGRYDAHGKKMKDRLPASGVATRAQYINARYLVNIQDKADLIEDYAQVFERAVRDGGQS